MILFRPTGQKEAAILFQSDISKWPPRLADQPTFYPVLNQPYATQIARDWKTQFDEFVGYVTRFEVDNDYVSQFPIEKVGGREHLELWVPAEDLEAFNRNLRSRIEVLESFVGKRFESEDAITLLIQLSQTTEATDFSKVIKAHAESIFLNYPYWHAETTEKLRLTQAQKVALLERIETSWKEYFPNINLCHQGDLTHHPSPLIPHTAKEVPSWT